jgi:ketosteroid isomerase-like protein
MTAGARTPEELDMLLEDAFVQRDRAVLDGVFDDAAVLMDAAGTPARGSDAIGRALAELWGRDRTYIAGARQVLQARDTALIAGDAGIHVLRRGDDGTWRAAISLLVLDSASNP